MPQTTWNHRVLRRHTAIGKVYYAVHEVYYTDGVPDSWTDEPIQLINDSMEDMLVEVEQIRRALDTPILEVVDNKLQEV